MNLEFIIVERDIINNCNGCSFGINIRSRLLAPTSFTAGFSRFSLDGLPQYVESKKHVYAVQTNFQHPYRFTNRTDALIIDILQNDTE